MIKLYTIGHSNHSLDQFIRLLEENGIMTLVDVRSAPYSRYNPHFNRENLEASLRERDIQYAYAGKFLGGRPTDPACYKSRTLPADGADYVHELDYPSVVQRGNARTVSPAAGRRTAGRTLARRGDHSSIKKPIVITEVTRMQEGRVCIVTFNRPASTPFPTTWLAKRLLTLRHITSETSCPPFKTSRPASSITSNRLSSASAKRSNY